MNRAEHEPRLHEDPRFKKLQVAGCRHIAARKVNICSIASFHPVGRSMCWRVIASLYDFVGIRARNMNVSDQNSL